MYFANLDKNNNVIEVIVAESITWCNDNLQGNWVKIGVENIVGINYIYDEVNDVFVSPIVEEIVLPVMEEVINDN